MDHWFKALHISSLMVCKTLRAARSCEPLNEANKRQKLQSTLDFKELDSRADGFLLNQHSSS